MICLTLAGLLALPFTPFFEMDRAEIDSVLAQPAWREASFEERLLELTRLRSGTPYQLGCLGEEREPDTDPLFRLDRADCTVLVITDAALAHSENLDGVERSIRRIHYRDAVPVYENRYHFTTDRILFSPWFEGITSELFADSLLESVSLTLNCKESGERLLPIDWEREITVRYLPSGRIAPDFPAGFPPFCGVAFVNLKNVAAGYLVSHEGILLGGKTLHHASSAADKVVNVDFRQYLPGKGDTPRFDGVIFYQFK